MAELLGISKISAQMQDILIGKTIKTLTLSQEKALNIPVATFQERTKGATITDIYQQGKWIVITLDNGEDILLSFILGSDIFYFEHGEVKPQKYKHNVKVLFTDDSGYTVRFWWFEKFFLVRQDEVEETIKAADNGIDPLDEAFTLDYFTSLLKGKKTQIKSFLMSQKAISGLSGMYMHDILFKARLHPQKNISDMTEKAIEQLFHSILDTIRGYRHKMDFFGENGTFDGEDFIVAYKDNHEPCPICSEPIAYIKTGSTSTYICPVCQKR